MTTKKLLNLLNSYILQTHNINENQELSDISWKLENSKKNEIIFYKINTLDKQSAFVELKKRLEFADFGILVLNILPDDKENLKNLVLIPEGHFLSAQKVLLDLFYPLNLEKKKLIGITGTNGKSTTVDLAKQISNLMGKKACSIGTLGVKTWNGFFATESGLTTPPFIELRKLLFNLFQEHEACFMEVSSHAIASERIFGLKFDAIAWTSFGQDHLDYHKTMEEYFQVKKKLFTHYLKSGGAFFVPGEEKDLLLRLQDCKALATKSLKESGFADLPIFLSAGFNQRNLELALDLNRKIWREDPQINLFDLRSLEGRFSIQKIGSKIFIIDFAHTPDALENICKSILQTFPDKKLCVVFGCGGDRDPIKRPLMGNVVNEYGDKIFLTMDNPRSEDPSQIIADICKGELSKTKVSVVLDRESAIRQSFKEVGNHHIILIAGKGHEDYQIIKGVKYEYSDLKVLEKLAAEEGKILEDVHGRL